MKFKLIAAARPEEFESTINDLLEKGWVLQGGPFVNSERLYWLMQAMVLPDKDGWVDLAPMVTQELR